MTSIPDFTYQQLDEERNEIRVLTFQKAASLAAITPEHVGLVSCTIDHVSLDDRLGDYEQFVVKTPPLSRRSSYDLWHNESNDRYTQRSPDRADTPPDRESTHPRYHRFAWGDYGALSYTWGDQSQKRPIMLNGALFYVGRNLEAALRRLARHPDYGNGLKLWADAICINQSDLRERSRQVRLMGDIFGRALLVTIWLGELPEADNDTVNLVKLQELVSRCVDDAATREAVETTVQDPHLKTALRAAVEPLATVTYWTRTWIIQEKCLGPFNASLLFGPYVFRLIPLRNFLTHANNIAGAIKSREAVWQILKLMELAVRHQERQPENRSDEDQKRADMDELALLLMLGRLAQEKDPRDKVYGLMGMIPKYVTQHIEPDYSASVEHVFTNFALALILGFNNLNMVLTGNQHPTFAVPTWVPDLTSRWDPHLWSTNCNATPNTSAQFSISSDGRTLTVKGLIYDTINGTAPNPGYVAGHLAPLHAATQPTASPPPSYDLKTAIVRTLHRDATYDCYTHPTVLDIPWLDHLPAARPADDDGGAHAARVDEMRHQGWAPVLHHAAFVDFQQLRALLDAHYAPWPGRRFRSFFPGDVPRCGDSAGFVRALEKHQGIVYPVFTTGRGLFGAGIHPVRVGDVVAVVMGCYAPVVLRREGGAWRAVGHCFVEGLMRGEAVRGGLAEEISVV